MKQFFEENIGIILVIACAAILFVFLGNQDSGIVKTVLDTIKEWIGNFSNFIPSLLGA